MGPTSDLRQSQPTGPDSSIRAHLGERPVGQIGERVGGTDTAPVDRLVGIGDDAHQLLGRQFPDRGRRDARPSGQVGRSGAVIRLRAIPGVDAMPNRPRSAKPRPHRTDPTYERPSRPMASMASARSKTKDLNFGLAQTGRTPPRSSTLVNAAPTPWTCPRPARRASSLAKT